jgi:hypothetical protein
MTGKDTVRCPICGEDTIEVSWAYMENTSHGHTSRKIECTELFQLCNCDIPWDLKDSLAQQVLFIRLQQQ